MFKLKMLALATLAFLSLEAAKLPEVTLADFEGNFANQFFSTGGINIDLNLGTTPVPFGLSFSGVSASRNHGDGTSETRFISFTTWNGPIAATTSFNTFGVPPSGGNSTVIASIHPHSPGGHFTRKFRTKTELTNPKEVAGRSVSHDFPNMGDRVVFHFVGIRNKKTGQVKRIIGNFVQVESTNPNVPLSNGAGMIVSVRQD